MLEIIEFLGREEDINLRSRASFQNKTKPAPPSFEKIDHDPIDSDQI